MVDTSYPTLGHGKFEYDLNYYSGAQAAIFFEHILIDEVTSLQWTVQQSKIPIYGYASQTFDEMAKGTIIVQGSFSINFVEAGYLWASLDKIKNQIRTNGTGAGAVCAWAQGRKNMEWLGSDEGYQIKDTAEAYIKWKKAMKDKQNSMTPKDRAIITDSKKELNQTTPSITEQINDLVWGPDVTDTSENFEDENLRRTDKRELNGFDIYLRFKHSSSSSYTIQRIQDVHLLGKAQTIVIDENPVQEVYSFYAKNVI